jgi:hypothetical protein
VTRLPSAYSGTFGFFPDIGCFQDLNAGQRLFQGQGVCELANPGATLLLLSFGPKLVAAAVGGASQEEKEVDTAFAGCEMLAAESADTAAWAPGTFAGSAPASWPRPWPRSARAAPGCWANLCRSKIRLRG